MIEVGLDFAFKVKDDGSLRQDPPKKERKLEPKTILGGMSWLHPQGTSWC